MNNKPSPFHKGEQQLQRQLGVRDRMERFGQKVIRDTMPEQHREFYQQLSYLLVGHVDEQEKPWASLLLGDSGFIHSADNQHLTINASPFNGDPLGKALQKNSKLGLLGIDLNTRRRNRISGHVSHTATKKFSLKVDQAFGNCPKYIQLREQKNQTPNNTLAIETKNIKKLDTQALALISNADTFFVSSFIANGSGQPSEGVDISHRGGMPGFIHINSSNTITIPDYSGNLHFNTLGNFIENPKAGLLFIDFDKGHLLMLSGKVNVLLNAPDTHNFAGAERLWTFETTDGVWIKNALTTQWSFKGYSPFLGK